MTLLAVAALLILTLSSVLLQVAQPREIPNLSGVLPWQSTLPLDVPTFRGDWRHSGALPGDGPGSKPAVLWQTTTAGQMRAQPLLVAGVVYATSMDGNVYAFDYATGAEHWRSAIGGAPEGQFTVAEGIVYVGDNNPQESYGTLFALDSATGQELWRLADVQTSAPLVVDGVLYTGTGDGMFHAYDAASGKERWQVGSVRMSRGATYADGLIYFGGEDGAVYALDAADGTMRWSFETNGGELGTVAVVDGIAYEVAFDGPADQLYAIDAATGEERWRFAINAPLQPPAIHAGIVYLPGGDGSVYALDAERGTVRWRFDVGDPWVHAPTLAGNTLYVTSGSPILYAVDAATGKRRWQIDVDGPFGTSPMVSGGIVYAVTMTGTLYALSDRQADAPPALPAAERVQATDAPISFMWRVQNGTERISEPHGMAIAPDGNIWLTEGGKNRFLIFSPEGEVLGAWGIPGPDEGEFDFYWPNGGGSYGGIAFDAQGNIFVADTGNNRIQKFDAQRQFVTAWGGEGAGDSQLIAPVQVAVDSAGNVYVGTDEGVQKFANDGAFLGRVGALGQGENEYACTALMSLDARDHLFIADCENHRVMEFAPDGTLVTIIGSAGRDPGQLSFPVATAIDEAGNLFVSEARAPRVQVFDANGQSLGQWGSFGADDGQFGEPGDILLDGLGHIYVTDYVNGTLQKFRLEPPLTAGEGTPVP